MKQICMSVESRLLSAFFHSVGLYKTSEICHVGIVVIGSKHPYNALGALLL